MRWNLGGISPGQVEESPFPVAGRAMAVCRVCRWGDRKVRAAFPDCLYFLCKVGGKVIP